MPTIEEYDSDPDDMPLSEVSPPPPPLRTSAQASPLPNVIKPSLGSPIQTPMGSGPKKSWIAGIEGLPRQDHYQVMKKEDYTGWETIYPIYIDRKRRQGKGGRRVSKTIALEYPLAEIMAQACGFLGVENVYEPLRVHPQDWENPGRVKVLLKKDGNVLNAQIPTKRVLLHHLCSFLSVHLPQTGSTSSKPALERRLPALSPAISHGVLDAALKGKGLMGALTGGGTDEVKEVEEPPVVAAKKVPPKMPKQRRIVKRR
ncbi:BQ2448_1434 [Microbotryum intermedium]|uniref:BQ2448_1434 protein n=1 Tax=Microbotryum intermedium TaxID=269621 RepID=A0A238F866_9BASI|nr:BQ2448_1434 [Microbotryum intermedium]